MRMMKKTLLLSIVVCLFISGVVSAELVRGINLDFVTIGNAGNVADSSGYGAVEYSYRIGKYEITNGQWDAFVSASGAPTGNPSSAYESSAYWTGTNVPTNCVSWYEAAQFCNYLTSGDKYSGAYSFDLSGNFLGVDRDSAISTYGSTYVIPTEDEWYKAAYYTGSGYSLYANGTDTAPIAGTDTNYDWAIGQPWAAGTGAEEQNGTYDMMGNVWEWNETLIAGSASARCVRGGSYFIYYDYSLRSSNRINFNPDLENFGIGFRVASVPEPASLVLLGLSGLALRYRKP